MGKKKIENEISSDQPKLFDLSVRSPEGVRIVKKPGGWLSGIFGGKTEVIYTSKTDTPPDDNFQNMNGATKLDPDFLDAQTDHFRKKKKIKTKSREEAKRIAHGRKPRISVSDIEAEEIPVFGKAPPMVLTEAQILHDVAQMAVMDEKESSRLQGIDQMTYSLSERERREIKKAIQLARKARDKNEYYEILTRNCPATLKYFREATKTRLKVPKQMEKHSTRLFETEQVILEPNYPGIANRVQASVNMLIQDDRIMKVPIFVERKFLIWSRRTNRVLTITHDFWNIDGEVIDIKTSNPKQVAEVVKKIQTYNRARLAKIGRSGGNILWDDKWAGADNERTKVSVSHANLEDADVSPGKYSVLLYAHEGGDNGQYASVSFTEEEILKMGGQLYKTLRKLAKK